LGSFCSYPMPHRSEILESAYRTVAGRAGPTQDDGAALVRRSVETAAADVPERVIAQQTGHKSMTVLRRFVMSGSLFRESAARVGL
jgi:hypothetical protein